MQLVQDFFDEGSVIAACLQPTALARLEPTLRRLLAGQQLFIKQPDGSYRPKGSQLGLTQGFLFADFREAALRAAEVA